MRTSVFILCLLLAGPVRAGAWLHDGELRGMAPVATWKDLRDRDIEKQGLDYSCGAAALATLMQGWYGVPVSEAEILALLPERAVATSLLSLARLSEREWKLQATGLALDFAALGKLRVPVIVYLEPRGRGHFSVLRGVGPGGQVWLADPSWGNRLFTAYQFRQMWETRDHPSLKGRILLLQDSGAPGGLRPLNPVWFNRERLSREIRRSSCRNCGAGLL